MSEQHSFSLLILLLKSELESLASQARSVSILRSSAKINIRIFTQTVSASTALIKAVKNDYTTRNNSNGSQLSVVQDCGGKH